MQVIGVDMTEEQIGLAEGLEDWHATKFGYSKPNTLFVHGSIEDLKKSGELRRPFCGNPCDTRRMLL